LLCAAVCGILAEHQNPVTKEFTEMTCSPETLKQVPLFALLDDEELAVLAAQVELKTFARQQRIYKMGSAGGTAYVMVSGSVKVTTLDQDNQEVTVDEPAPGDLFGFASLFEQTPHQTDATAWEETTCVEIDRDDIFVLLQRKPHAGMDLLTALGRQIHSAHDLVWSRAMRNPNDVIEEEATWPEQIADDVARFGGSWRFIILFAVVLAVYSAINVVLGQRAWDPYPFILLNLFLSMLAAIQAPVIMMSQNRQDRKDRVRGDIEFDVNRRAEMEIRSLARQVYLVDEKIGDLEDLLRERVVVGQPSNPAGGNG
jgi:CRP/FNR family transcriptional regulator, cyclic AMP receptor protein